jgi:hypothetical protein
MRYYIYQSIEQKSALIYVNDSAAQYRISNVNTRCRSGSSASQMIYAIGLHIQQMKKALVKENLVENITNDIKQIKRSEKSRNLLTFNAELENRCISAEFISIRRLPKQICLVKHLHEQRQRSEEGRREKGEGRRCKSCIIEGETV